MPGRKRRVILATRAPAERLGAGARRSRREQHADNQSSWWPACCGGTRAVERWRRAR